MMGSYSFSYFTIKETVAIVDRMLDALMIGMPITGVEGSQLRRLVGNLKDTSDLSIKNHTLGTDLQACFDAAYAAGATLPNMDNVRIKMLEEATPQYLLGAKTVSAGIIFSLVEQSRIIVDMDFVSRTEVDVILVKMIDVFDTAKLALSEIITGLNYQYAVALCASLIQHLVSTERELPRIVNYSLPAHLPSLVIANFLYADASRSDEIINENKVVHPAFCPRNISALSE